MNKYEVTSINKKEPNKIMVLKNIISKVRGQSGHTTFA